MWDRSVGSIGGCEHSGVWTLAPIRIKEIYFSVAFFNLLKVEKREKYLLLEAVS